MTNSPPADADRGERFAPTGSADASQPGGGEPVCPDCNDTGYASDSAIGPVPCQCDDPANPEPCIFGGSGAGSTVTFENPSIVIRKPEGLVLRHLATEGEILLLRDLAQSRATEAELRALNERLTQYARIGADYIEMKHGALGTSADDCNDECLQADIMRWAAALDAAEQSHE